MSDAEPVWLDRWVLIAVHERLLVAHGGARGIRDRDLLDSALARPRQIHAYEPAASLFDLAAATAEGIVRNHPFADANKRAAFMAAYVFLARNGLDPVMSEAEAVTMMLGLAAGEIDRAAFAAWLAETCREW